MFVALTIALAWASFSFSSVAPVGSATDAIAKARMLVEKELAPKVPGLAVAVGVNGKIMWSAGFGYADLAEKTKVTPTTRLLVGSKAKPM
jgi:CubicO group peptidase (beta-lactamase class C family)